MGLGSGLVGLRDVTLVNIGRSRSHQDLVKVIFVFEGLNVLEEIMST